MEILSTTTPSTSHIFPKLSFLSTNISFTTRTHKTQLKFNSKPSVHLPFSPNLAFPGAKRFQISAHFGGPTSRRNSLRKKLTQQKQVGDIPLILDSNSEIQNQVLDFNAEKLESNIDNDRVDIGSSKFEKSSSDIHSESDLSSKLKSWVDQYKADSEFWGIGSGRIFTVFQDSDGKVKRVDVDEEEIIRRSGLEVALYKASELEDLTEVNLKISHAKSLAREMENGNNVLSKTSSVAKFVVSSGELGFMSSIRGVSFPPDLLLRMSRVGIVVLCGLCVFWAVKRLFRGDENKIEYSSLEKEMLRRKMKARMEKDKLGKGSVEVIPASKKVDFPSTQKPLLDRQDLMDNITEAKASNSTLTLQTSSREEAVKSTNFDDKIREINAMARHARELEKKGEGGLDGSDEEDNQSVSGLSSVKKVIQEDRESDFTSLNRHHNEHIGKLKDVGETIVSTTLDDPKCSDTSIHVKTSVENSETTNSTTSEILVSNVGETKASEDMGDGVNLLETTKTSKITDSSATNLNKTDKFSAKSKPKVIRSVKEAREYLSKKGDRKEQRKDLPSQNFCKDNLVSQNRKVEETSQRLDGNHNECNVSIFTSPDLINEKSASSEHARESITLKNVDHETADELYVANNHHIIEASSSTEDSTEKEPSSINFPVDRDLGRQRSQETQVNDTWPQSSDLDAKSDSASSQSACEPNLNAEGTIPTDSNNAEDIVKEYKHQMPASYSNPAVTDSSDVAAPAATKDNWMESNFHEFEPVAKKIAAGFKDNYMVARQKKINQELNFDSETGVPEYDGDGELDWMKDDRLREIVFQVRENELMGRDPFHLMDVEDKKAFFDGLEKKVEKVNENLQNLHQWVHSNIENLDYGADGISVNDPLEKIIPRWKGPPIDTSPQSLDDYMKQRQVLINENLRSQTFKNQKAESPLQTSVESSPSQNGVNTSVVDNQYKNNQNPLVKPPKIVIEGSDGSVRAGKKSGKEYWEHTKKWTRGFLEVYNAETDPEIKATMKDMGKDLKRWITEKEIKESADMMDKLPERGRKLIQEKLYKVKKEMELYGPQAVVNKYSEYTEEKEEDYLWWLDLPFVLCIELYTNQDDQNIGYYSLEMASDLELNPKQYHVIAFEDTGDCKNMCYIIQSHLEMLGNGNAFVVAQPPKDAFREAKANGFNVTVIRKGELKLNVDQNLEEVEEQITEIGSKMYHDKITKGRSVDISSLAKGVFGIKNKTTKKRKRSRKKLKKPTNY